MTGFFTCYGTANVQSSFSWRLPFALLASYSFVFSASMLIWLPASPRWLTLHGKTQEAAAAWEKLDVPAADREKILDQYDSTVVETAIPDASGGTSAAHITSATVAVPKLKKAKLLDVFSSDARPRLFLAVFLMGMQQLSGIDGVLYVSTCDTLPVILILSEPYRPPHTPFTLAQKLTIPSTLPSSSNKPASPPTNPPSSPPASPPS